MNTAHPINRLIPDIYEVVEGKGGWDAVGSEYFESRIHDTLSRRMGDERPEHGPSLRMSNIGTPCERKLWYSVNNTGTTEELRGKVLLKFMYGDVLEDLLLSLAKAAGHRVEGEQDEMEINGIKGHRDAVIDGVLIDVKSASSFAFKKFKENALREDGNDAFGYIAQLSAYLTASQDDPLVTEKREAGFLVVDKVTGELCLDMYDLKKDVDKMPEFIEHRKLLMGEPIAPIRSFNPEPYQKSGNMKLPTVPCGYCEHKHQCHPGLRTFLAYGNKPVYLTTVKREPKMVEVTDA